MLLEYVYADRGAVNTPGNEFRISTTNAPLWRTRNGHTGEPQLLNADSAWQIQDGSPLGTGNVRNRSFAYVNPHRGGLLDIDKVTFYNDYDPELTATGSLPITFLNEKAPVYDTIKLHLVQGFNFEDNRGLALTIKCKDIDGNNIVLCNLSYQRDDLWETLNPSSFFFAGRVYDSYLEVRVLSLYDLINEYWLGPLDGDTTVERITNGVGLLRQQGIQVSFSWVRDREQIDGQDFIELYATKEVDLPTRDQFETIAAYVGEATDADYFEFYATYNGSIIEPYILDLNSSGGDYMILHDMVLSEYVQNPQDDTYTWIKTQDFQLAQTDDFDLPNVYRPVVRNNGAVAFKLEYVARLYNRADNSQIWKTASMVSYSANKYGRKLRQINLGSNPVQTKLYNKRVVKDFTVVRETSEPAVESVRYVTSFIDSTQVSVSFQLVEDAKVITGQPKSAGLSSASSSGRDRVYPNGMARVFIPSTTSYLRFVLRTSTPRGDSMLNLHGAGTLRLSFSSGRGDEVEIDEYPSLFAAKGSGEAIFRVSELQAKSILALEDRTFSIFLVNEKGERTFVYSGKFFSVEEYQNLVENDRVAAVEAELAKQVAMVAELTQTVQERDQFIAAMEQQTVSVRDAKPRRDDQSYSERQVKENQATVSGTKPGPFTVTDTSPRLK